MVFDFSLSYRHLVCHRLITTFGLSLAYYDMILFIIFLQHFIYMEEIHISKIYLISRRYQIMFIDILNNQNRKYYSYYIIKFINFMLIYYTINQNIISSYITFNNLYLGCVNIL